MNKKDKKREYDRRRYLENREANIEYQKKYRKENREKCLMACIRYNKEHRQEKAIQNRKYIEARKAWLLEFKETHPCEKCGESHPGCIEFHHRDPKEKKFAISENSKGKCPKTLKDEISKCDILCSNCHRILHYEELHAA